MSSIEETKEKPVRFEEQTKNEKNEIQNVRNIHVKGVGSQKKMSDFMFW